MSGLVCGDETAECQVVQANEIVILKLGHKFYLPRRLFKKEKLVTGEKFVLEVKKEDLRFVKKLK